MELNNNKTAPIVQEMDKNQLSLDLMHRMRLTGMATAFEESLTTTIADTMTPDAFLSWLLSREWDYRSAAAIERLIKSAGFRYKAYPEQIDYNLNSAVFFLVRKFYMLRCLFGTLYVDMRCFGVSWVFSKHKIPHPNQWGILKPQRNTVYSRKTSE